MTRLNKPRPGPTGECPEQELVSRHALSIPLAAKYAGVTNFRMEEAIRNGEIPFRDHGQARLIDADDIDTWIKLQPKKRIDPKTKAIQEEASIWQVGRPTRQK